MWNISQLTDAQLHDILIECLKFPWETDWIEFKENYVEYKMLGERLCGLSNAAAFNGRDFWFLIYWISDNKEILGTKFQKETAKSEGNQPLEIALSKDIKPSNISITIKHLNFQKSNLAIFIIPAAYDTPTTFKNQAFIRIWSCTSLLRNYPDKERKLWNNVYNKTFEKQISISWVEIDYIFDLLDVDKYFRLLSIPKPENIDSIIAYLQNDGIVNRSLSRFQITNLGWILLAKNLSLFPSLKRKWIRVVLYDGIDKTSPSKSIDGNKGYALWFEGVLNYIKTVMPSFEKIENWRRIEINTHTPIAIRELVANALIHQDLSISGTGPLIEIYRNRIEITNPGKPLIEDINRLIDAPPISRNQDLASLMRRMRFCEELWGGIDKAITEIEMKKLPAPRFAIAENNMTATLYSSESFYWLTKEDKIRACFQHCVIQYIRKEYMTNSSFRERMNLSEKQYTIASRVINDTIELWYIKVLDSESKAKRYTKYVPFWHHPVSSSLNNVI